MLKITFNYNEFYNLMISILNSSLNLSTMKLNESDQFNNHSEKLYGLILIFLMAKILTPYIEVVMVI